MDKTLDITLNPQEESVHANFIGPIVSTIGFQNTFGKESLNVAAQTVAKIQVERVISDEGADYLQTASYKGITYWVIQDGSDVVTCLLPEEY